MNTRLEESISVIAMLGGNRREYICDCDVVVICICEHEVRGESISVIAMLGGNMYL